MTYKYPSKGYPLFRLSETELLKVKELLRAVDKGEAQVYYLCFPLREFLYWNGTRMKEKIKAVLNGRVTLTEYMHYPTGSQAYLRHIWLRKLINHNNTLNRRKVKP